MVMADVMTCRWVIRVFAIASIAMWQTAFAQPDATAIPDTINFGEVSVGGSDSRSFAVNNAGNSTAFVSVFSNNSSFTIASAPFSIAVGDAGEVIVSFSPSVAGRLSGNITIQTTNPTDTDPTVHVVGTAVTPQVQAIPDSLDFGDVTIDKSASRTFSLTNSSPDSVVMSIESNSSRFTISSAPDTMVPGGAAEVEVTYSPIVDGEASATITISTESVTGAATVTAIANAVTTPQIGAEPLTIEFPPINVSETRTELLVLQNVGTAEQELLQIPSIWTTGDASQFSPVDTSLTLAGGEEQTFAVTYAPTVAGSHEIVLGFNHDSSVGPFAGTAMEVRISGTAIALPQLGADDPPNKILDFSDVSIGSTSGSLTGSVTSGSNATIIQELWTTSEEFTVTPTDPSLLGNSLARDASFAFEVDFAPTDPGRRDAELLIRSNDPQETIRTWSLTGVGVAPQLGVDDPTSRILDFSDVLIGSTSDHLTGSVTSGSNNTIIQELWTTSDEYTVTPTDPSVLGSSLARDASFAFEVDFTPIDRGRRDAELLIRSNDPQETIRTWSLTGVGVAPQMAVPEREELSFGSVTVGTSRADSVIVSNNSSASGTTLEVSVSLESQDFKTDVEELTISPGQSRVVRITYTPSFPNEAGSLLALRATNDPDSTTVEIPLVGNGVSPSVQVNLVDSDYTLNFGSVRRIVGVATRQFELVNSGSDIATIAAIVTDDPMFSAQLDDPLIVDVGGTARVSVTFSPPGLGPHEGILTITGDLGKSGDLDSLVVYLTGHGTSPRLSVHPTSHVFQTLTVPNSDTLSVLVQNSGDEDLNLAWGSSQAPFVVESGQASLAPDQSREIRVIFSPEEASEFIGVLELSSNDPAAATANVSLSGIGVQTDLSLTSSIDFGLIRVGKSKTIDLNVGNDGGTRVVLNVESLTGVFTAEGEELMIDAGGTKAIRVTFTPDAQSAESASLVLVDENQKPFRVTLAGHGIEPEIGLPTSDQLQAPVRGGESQALSVLVQNTGTDTLSIGGIIVEEDGADAFNRVTSAPLEIAPGKSDFIQVSFRPPSAGEFGARLIVQSDDRLNPVDTVQISGQGKTPILQVSSSSDFSFGSVRHEGASGGGATGRIELQVSNTGDDTLYVESVEVADTTQFSIDPLTADIPPGGNESLSAWFHPQGPNEQRTAFTLHLLRPHSSRRWETELGGRGVYPKLEALPSVEFDPAKVNLGADVRELAITNSGTDTLRISSLIIEDSENFPFEAPSLPVDLAPRDLSNDALVLQLQFTPKHPDLATVEESTLPYLTRLLIGSDDVDLRTTVVRLTGDGSVSTAAPVESEISFGSVQIGSVGEQVLGIDNSGDQAVFRARFGDSQFSVIGDTLFTVPNQGHQVHLSFVPLSRHGNQTVSDVLTLVDTTTGRSFRVDLSGTGIQGALEVVETALAFDSIRVDVAVPQSVTLSNSGNDTMTVSLQIAGTASSQFVSFVDTVFLEIGQATTVPVTYTPSAEGQAAASLTVVPVDSDIPAARPVALSGVGTAPAMAAQNVSFNEITFGSGGDGSVEVQNQGTDDMTVYHVEVESPYREVFTLSHSSQFVVPRRETISVQVEVSATDTILLGTESVELSIVHEASASPGKRETTTVDLGLRVLDRAAPEVAFSGDFRVLDPRTSQEELPFAFDVYLRDDSGQIDLSQTQLRWRYGGADLYTSQALTGVTDVGGGRLRGKAQIDGVDDARSGGVEFYLQAVDRSGNKAILGADGRQAGVEEAAVSPFGVSVRLNAQEGTLVEDQPGTYHMVSVPMLSDANSVFELVRRALGEDGPVKADKTRWRLFELAGSEFLELKPNLGGRFLKPGGAFWLILNKRPISVSAGTGWSTPTVPAFDTTLTRGGWHTIGHPYSFVVPWRNVEVDGTPLFNGKGGGVSFFEYGSEFNPGGKPAWGIKDEGLRPWRGYAVYIPSPARLRIHPRVSLQARRPVAPEVEGWHVELEVTAGDAVDLHNVFGVAVGAAKGWDSQDSPEPPAVGEFLRAFFAPVDSLSSGMPLSADMRPIGDGATWHLHVESSMTSRLGTLRFPDVGGLPLGVHLRLFDVSSGRSQDVREQPEYSFRVTGENRFALIAGALGYVERAQSVFAPAVSTLSAAYPNPFNSSVAIDYQISEPGRVHLDVYNVAGQRVRSLLDALQPAGYHRIQWNGMTAEGGPAATGVYIIQMRMRGQMYANKLLLVR
jgi:hypothetical protein